jgi:hypothetical protein
VRQEKDPLYGSVDGHNPSLLAVPLNLLQISSDLPVAHAAKGFRK